MDQCNLLKEIANLYDDVINNVCELYTKIGINNDLLKIFETYIYMRENGYLSNNLSISPIIPKEFEKAEENYIPIDLCGCYILQGYNLCRHSTDFLCHIYHNLGFDSNELFVYHPNLTFVINNYRKNELNSEEIQHFVNASIKDFNYFSRSEHHFTKCFDGIEIKVNYEPPRAGVSSFANHSLNIVRDTKTNKSYILDSFYNRIGNRVFYSNELHMHDLIKIYFLEFALKDCCDIFSLTSYYHINYFDGYNMLLNNEFNGKNEIDRLIMLKEEVKEYDRLFKRFWKSNKKTYSKASAKMKKLII